MPSSQEVRHYVRFIEAGLVFGLCGFLGLGGFGAGAFGLIMRFFNIEAGEKLGGNFQQLIGIFGLIGCAGLYIIFYT